MEGIHIVIVFLAALIVLFPVAFVWYITDGGIYMAVKRYLQKSKQSTTCSIDSDCPAGYNCIGGKCIPA
ncbi:hypothetical protein ACFLU9_01320 [Chloroflexota bacterium]